MFLQSLKFEVHVEVYEPETRHAIAEQVACSGGSSVRGKSGDKSFGLSKIVTCCVHI